MDGDAAQMFQTDEQLAARLQHVETVLEQMEYAIAATRREVSQVRRLTFPSAPEAGPQARAA